MAAEVLAESLDSSQEVIASKSADLRTVAKLCLSMSHHGWLPSPNLGPIWWDVDSLS
jgi:hypothetical protein